VAAAEIEERRHEAEEETVVLRTDVRHPHSP
jgi:hypothetical protein